MEVPMVYVVRFEMRLASAREAECLRNRLITSASEREIPLFSPVIEEERCLVKIEPGLYTRTNIAEFSEPT